MNKKKSILIVDRQEISRTGLRIILAKVCQNETILESDGNDAVGICESERPALVILSTFNPLSELIAATRAIKETSPSLGILIIASVLSSFELATVLNAGAHGYCSKASSSIALASAIESVIQGALWIDPYLAEEAISVFCANSQLIGDIPKSDPLSSVLLSDRETEVLTLLVDGLSNKEMADKLGVGVETIKTHMRHVMEKLSVSDRTQAAIKALRLGLLKKH